MSRTYQNPASTARRPPAATSPARPTPLSSNTSRSTGRGAPAPAPPSSSTSRGLGRGTVAPAPPLSNTSRNLGPAARAPAPPRATVRAAQPPRPRVNETVNDDPYRENHSENFQERVTRIGDGYQMFTPTPAKHNQMRMQAEKEQRQYQEHIERTRLQNLNEVHRLGGGQVSVAEVRQRQAEQYRREKFVRLEKSHQDQLQKKEEEEREIAAKKQAARLQSVMNEKKNQASSQRSMKPSRDRLEQSEEAFGWTDATREQDRRETMDRFLNQFSQKSSNQQSRSDENDDDHHNGASIDKKLQTLREMLPDVDMKTLEYRLKVFHGDVDAVIQDLLN